MGLGQVQEQPTKIWLSIYNGKVEHSANGQKNYYSYVEGKLQAIYTTERNYNGEAVTRWIIELRGEDGEIYAISLPYSSGTFKSIALSLASDETITPDTIVRIEPYVKGSFTNVVVWSDGVKLDWVTKELPSVANVKVGNNLYKDDSKRMEFIASCVRKVTDRLQASASTGEK